MFHPRHFTVPLLAAAFIHVCLQSCGKKQTPYIATVGTDTLTIEEIRRLAPDATADSAAMVARVILQRAVAPCADTAAREKTGDPASAELAAQISRHTSTAWSADAARCMLNSAGRLKQISDSLKTSRRIMAYLDSALKDNVTMRNTADPAGLLSGIDTASLPDSVKTTDDLTALLAAVLGISRETAQTVTGFIGTADRDAADSLALNEMIKGLVYDGKSAPPKKRELREETADRSEMVLKYRSQQSIQDSIQKHLVNLNALYKKKLKSYPGISGTVVVELRVGPDGRVVSTAIARTDIPHQDFTGEFQAYLRTIRFLKTPEKLGNMTFQFPFVFSPEE